MVKRSEYIDKIIPFIDTPVVKVITGIRRSGKSTIMTQLADYCLSIGTKEKNILSINMESLVFSEITDYKILYSYIINYFSKTKGKKYLFIDEVQEISGWEKAVASLLAEKIADITITGSNAHLLSSELGTLLTGRYVTIPVYPLTFSEFLVFRKKASLKHRQTRDDEFNSYLQYGGLPGIHHFPDNNEVILEYLSSVMNSILLRDVVMRNSVRDPALLEKICRFAFDNCGNITTAKGIADYARSKRLNISVDTAISYLSFLENAHLITKVQRYDIKGKRHLDVYEKYYMGDTGLRHGFIGYRDNDIASLLENIVYNEVRVRGYSVSIGKIGEYEIDFIAEKNDDRKYIQVAYLLASRETIDREYRALESIPDNFPKFILSLDPVLQSNRGGIKHLHIIDFLLSKW